MRFSTRLLLVSLTVLVLTVCVGAKETVIHENDFTVTALTDYRTVGNWQVHNGSLATETGSGSAYLFYTIPEQYKGCDYQVDVDFVGHTSTGGIMIGGEGKNLTATAKQFHGFDCYVNSKGNKAVLGCYTESGAWAGNICYTDEAFAHGDLHLTVRVSGNEFVYRVYSPDGETQYCGISYKLGTNDKDVYESFGNTIGLRKFYADQGTFDNFRVTVFEDDVLPSLNKKLDMDGVSFMAGNLSKSREAVVGTGAMLTAEPMQANFKASVMLTPKDVSKIFFGMTDPKNGYAFTVNQKDETLALHKIKDGKYEWLAGRNMPVGDKAYYTYVSVHDGIASVLFDAYESGGVAFPSFELELKDYVAGKFGVWLEGGKVEKLSIVESEGKSGETYLNPVFTGADPEVRYFDGTYFAYRRVSEGKNIVRAYTSPDLVHWTERNIVYTHKDHYTAHTYMSPNVIYYDGLYYLFMACKNQDGKHRVTYSSSTSPYGPFEHIGGQQTLIHEDVSEIGGSPFIDDDGKVYLSFARFGNGNHTYREQVVLKDGVVTPVEGTLTHVVSPMFEYEIDGYGNISEGGILYKHNGYYYSTYASGHYLGHYGQSYLVAENINGPYTKYEYNEIITHNSAVDGAGDGMFVKSPDGTELWFVYHQHAEVGKVEPRQTRIDRVQFIPNPDGGPDILTINAPSTTPQTVPSFVGRYDVDKDGYTRLKDLLFLTQRQEEKPEYKGTYDLDGNGREDFVDLVTLAKKIVD